MGPPPDDWPEGLCGHSDPVGERCQLPAEHICAGTLAERLHDYEREELRRALKKPRKSKR